MNQMGADRGIETPAVLTLSQLDEVVEAIKESGEFCFDVETRGLISRHSDVLQLIDEEWERKKKTLKSTNPEVLAKSRQVIEDRWTKELALDPLRNDVFWIAIAVQGRSWAIPMGHPHGEMLTPAEMGDGSTIPPPVVRKLKKDGSESLAKRKYYVPATFAPPPKQLTAAQVFPALREVFMDESITKINQNIKFDVKSVAKYLGGIPKGLYVDTQLLQHILDENRMSYALQPMLKDNFGGYDPYHKHGKVGKTINSEAFSVACQYCHLDARWTWLLAKRLHKAIVKVPELVNVMHADQAVLPVLAQMEVNGIAVDQLAMKKLGKELLLDLNDNRLEMVNAGAFLGFNPDSTLDKQRLLFGLKRDGGLALKTQKKTPGGQPSTDSDTLLKLQGEHPLIDLIIKHQETKKLLTTYVDGLTPQLHQGRLHPQFHLHRTATGRLSASNPNLQNIPRDGKVRSLFVAEPGESLIVADYSQVELRVMCMFSQDPAMSEIFVKDMYDLHTATAAAVLGIDPTEVTAEDRQINGKMPNFLIGFGGGAKNLADKTGISLEHAEEVIANYEDTFSGIFTWKKALIEEAKKLGYSETLGGRRRRLPDFNSANKYERYRAERQAVNHRVQGTASEICKRALVRASKELPFPKVKMLVQVHDEIVISCPTDEVSTWLPKLEEVMGDGTVMMGIPLQVTGNSAGSWYDAK